MSRPPTVALGPGLLTLTSLVSACAGAGEDDQDPGGGSGEEKAELTVGSDSFAEAQIVGEMYAQVLEDAGYEVSRQLDLESREVRLPAMEDGQIDIAPEYLASLLSVVDPKATPSGEADEVVRQLASPLAEMGLKTLEPSDVVDTNAFVVTQDTADDLDLEAVSDLAGKAEELTIGGPPDSPERTFYIPGFMMTYD